MKRKERHQLKGNELADMIVSARTVVEANRSRITATVLIIVVAAFSTIYISQLVRQRVNQTYNDADFVAHQILHGTRQALELDFSSTRLDPNNRKAMQAAVEETLQTDPGLNSLLHDVLRALPDAHDGNHRAHADDDAQHGERRAHLVARESSQSQPKCVHEIHV